MVKFKKDRKPLTLHQTYILCGVIFFLATFLVYFLSTDSKVHILACDGNYYYTDQEIYKYAQATTETRIWLMPGTVLEKRVEKQALVDKVRVKKQNGKISFKVTEKLGIGYYVEDGNTYVLTVDNEDILIEDQNKTCLSHLPLMTGFSAKQRKQIASAYKASDDIDQTVFEKISEMTPFKTSYDNNMVKMTMIDGNIVYSSMSSLSMLTKYQAVLTQLQGNYVCLVLDADHNAIDKVDCNSMTTSKKGQLPIIEEEEEEEEDDKEKDDDKDKDEEDDDLDLDDLSEKEIIEKLDKVEDWVPDTSFGMELEYSASTDYYRNPYTNEYYKWDDTSMSFIILSR